MSAKASKTKGQTPAMLPSKAHPPGEAAPAPAWLQLAQKVWSRFRRFARDIAGVFLMAAAMLTLLALIGLTSGAWLTGWAAALRIWFGWGSILAVAVMGLGGLLLLYQGSRAFDNRMWLRVIALEVAAFAALAALAVLGGVSLERAEAGLDGGRLGWAIAYFVGLPLAPLPDGAARFLEVVLLLSVAVPAGVFGAGMFGPLLLWVERKLEAPDKPPARLPEDSPAVSVAAMDGPEPAASQASGQARRRTYIPPEFRKQFRVEESAPEASPGLTPRNADLPPLDILQEESSLRPNERHINQTAGLIEKTLAEFGVPARVVGFQVGPTVTQFAVEPGYFDRPEEDDSDARQKVRVSQIAALQRDLALALSARRLRIQAPVPGKSYVGIEVPNEKAAVVRLRPILEGADFHRLGSSLAVALGRDVSGQPLAADLARMPHLLIAGTTGSGKSICIAALTICLAMNNAPRNLRLVMIDPKMVELVRFNGLPHLLGKVETNLERIAGVLRWVVAEMERRYRLLEELRARDLEGYNRKAGRRKEYEPLPRIVVLIDELADLMMNSAETTEATIVRLAQMARATGIHLVVATQRPSTDVVTGLIKANFPARLSFSVASSVDSRVILDAGGAESLLGRGDMLFLPPEAGTPIRAQGVMVTDQEIEHVIAYWQETAQTDEEVPPWERMLAEEAVLADRDDLIRQAIQVIQETGHASASLFQRRLRIGYPRAARLMDELEELDVVGPSLGGGREREVLIDRDQPDPLAGLGEEDREGD